MYDTCSPILSPIALAVALGVSIGTLRNRRLRGVIPAPVRLGHRRYWLRQDVEHLPGFTDELPERVNNAQLAALLGVGITCLYEFVKRGDLPPPDHVVGGRRASWRVRDVVAHLKRLPR